MGAVKAVDDEHVLPGQLPAVGQQSVCAVDVDALVERVFPAHGILMYVNRLLKCTFTVLGSSRSYYVTLQ